MLTLKTIARASAVLVLLLTIPSLCLAVISLENVTKERAKELGVEVRANAAGPDAVRIAVEFEAKGAFAKYSRTDLEIHDGGKLLATSTLREEKDKPGRIVISFAADRALLEKITVRILTEHSARSRVGHDIQIKDFVELDKVR